LKVEFSQEQAELFKKASLDNNPLHFDNNYAKRSQFGSPVMHGAAAILKIIGIIFGANFPLIKSLKVDFIRPIYFETNYNFIFKKTKKYYSFNLKEGDLIILKGKISVNEAFKFSYNESNFFSKDLEFKSQNDIYKINSKQKTYLKKLLKTFNLSFTENNLKIYSLLLWSSYFVGVKFPGKQALFTSLEFVISNNKFFELEEIKGYFDYRFNSSQTFFKGNGFEGILSSLKRPEPEDISFEDIKKTVLKLPSFKNKNILITGSSRGLGNILAKSFLSKNANVYSVYKSYSQGVKELKLLKNKKIVNIKADLVKENESKKILKILGKESLDVFICNAFPLIQHQNFIEQNISSFGKFIDSSLSMSIYPIFYLLKKMKKGSTIVLISSNWIADGKAGFSHYLTSKGALENLFKSLAKENKDINFLLFRAPRMLTDQTNLSIKKDKLFSTKNVSAQILKEIIIFPKNQNYMEI
tara:strand:- start:24777 stop:26186 length:1410 start_codon:yes stop_codon:yes gene_type:complete